MSELVKTKHTKNKSFKPSVGIWDDDLLSDYYEIYFDNLSSKQLDKEFSKDLISISKILQNYPKSEREKYFNILSNIFEFYISKKIEKKLDNTFEKFLQVNG